MDNKQNKQKEEDFKKILKEYDIFKLTDPRTIEEKKLIYNVKNLTRKQRESIAERSGRYNNKLILQNKNVVVCSTFYYNANLKEASGQYHIYENGCLNLVTWYYNYKTREFL
jgi:hypothetical protein